MQIDISDIDTEQSVQLLSNKNYQQFLNNENSKLITNENIYVRETLHKSYPKTTRLFIAIFISLSILALIIMNYILNKIGADIISYSGSMSIIYSIMFRILVNLIIVLFLIILFQKIYGNITFHRLNIKNNFPTKSNPEHQDSTRSIVLSNPIVIKKPKHIQVFNKIKKKTDEKNNILLFNLRKSFYNEEKAKLYRLNSLYNQNKLSIMKYNDLFNRQLNLITDLQSELINPDDSSHLKIGLYDIADKLERKKKIQDLCFLVFYFLISLSIIVPLSMNFMQSNELFVNQQVTPVILLLRIYFICYGSFYGSFWLVFFIFDFKSSFSHRLQEKNETFAIYNIMSLIFSLMFSLSSIILIRGTFLTTVDDTTIIIWLEKLIIEHNQSLFSLLIMQLFQFLAVVIAFIRLIIDLKIKYTLKNINNENSLEYLQQRDIFSLNHQKIINLITLFFGFLLFGFGLCIYQQFFQSQISSFLVFYRDILSVPSEIIINCDLFIFTYEEHIVNGFLFLFNGDFEKILFLEGMKILFIISIVGLFFWLYFVYGVEKEFQIFNYDKTISLSILVIGVICLPFFGLGLLLIYVFYLVWTNQKYLEQFEDIQSKKGNINNNLIIQKIKNENNLVVDSKDIDDIKNKNFRYQGDYLDMELNLKENNIEKPKEEIRFYLPTFVLFNVFFPFFKDINSKVEIETPMIRKLCNFLEFKTIYISESCLSWLHHQPVFQTIKVNHPNLNFIPIDSSNKDENVFNYLLGKFQSTPLLINLSKHIGIATANKCENMLINDVDLLIFNRELHQFYELFKKDYYLPIHTILHIIPAIIQPINYHLANKFESLIENNYNKNNNWVKSKSIINTATLTNEYSKNNKN